MMAAKRTGEEILAFFGVADWLVSTWLSVQTEPERAHVARVLDVALRGPGQPSLERCLQEMADRREASTDANERDRLDVVLRVLGYEHDRLYGSRPIGMAATPRL